MEQKLPTLKNSKPVSVNVEFLKEKFDKVKELENTTIYENEDQSDNIN